jgi:hypothetical protein
MSLTQDGTQNFVNDKLPVGVAGDFAGSPTYATVLSGSEFAVAAPPGVTVGCFAWYNPATGLGSNYYQPANLLGFVHREGQALITTFLGFNASTVLTGNGITMYNQGSFLGQFLGGGTVGQKVYCDPLYGTLTANATGNGVSASVAASSLANTGVLTTGTVTGSAIAIGQVVTGTGIPAGSYIASGSGTTWQLANVVPIASGSWPVVASETIATQGVYETPFHLEQSIDVNAVATGSSIAAAVSPAPGGVFTVGTVTGGTFKVGYFLSGGSIPAGAVVQLLQLLTGTGGTGSTFLTSYASAVTSFTATGITGQTGRISSWG